MTVRALRIVAAVGAMVATAPAWGALSGNLFDGNFENVAALKNNYTYDNSNNPVGAHRFNADGDDFGLWIGRWGLSDLEQNGYYGQGGFSTKDYPRQLNATMVGVPGVVADDISNNNRSVDPYNPSNHIMETVAFYPTMAQWVQAPANQVAGPIQVNFDFFLNHWQADTSLNWFDQFVIQVYGSNFLPPHNVGMGTNIPGTTFNGFDPTGGANSVDTTIDGVHYKAQKLAQFGWGSDWTNFDPNRPEQWPGTNGWKHLDSTVPTVGWDDIDAADLGNVIIPSSIAETFPYYSVVINSRIYNEGHEYFWAVNGYGVNGNRASDTGPAIGFDNIDLRVSTRTPIPGDCNRDGRLTTDDVDPFIQGVFGGGPVVWPESDINQDGLLNSFDIPLFFDLITRSPDVLKADTNGDSLVNALDISAFVTHLVSGEFSSEADINKDSLVNALDISGFVTCLVNGACAGEAGGTVVPEPATLGLLLVSMWALRRRGGVA